MHFFDILHALIVNFNIVTSFEDRHDTVKDYFEVKNT